MNPDAGAQPVRAAHAALIHRLTIAGWLFLCGEFGFIMFQMERVRTVDSTRFATIWDQRIEVLGFLVLPPNIVALVPAAGIAALTTFLAGRERSPWLDALLRVVAAIALVLAAIGIAAIGEILTRAGQVELGSVFLRLGGIAMALGIAWLCRTSDVLGDQD